MAILGGHRHYNPGSKLMRQLARLLEPFGISPGTIRTSAVTVKGYLHGQFEEPFRRYLPDRSVTP